MLGASCHCGSVRIEVPRAPVYLNQCHCSVCRRYGTLWAYYERHDVQLRSDERATAIYSWGEKNLEFHHCRICGCVTHWKPVDERETRMAINGRLIDPDAIADVPIRQSPGPPA